ncbi:MAG: hypothetical protein IMHGJWDQ_000290 [Candidatus Fervidibacter sp.]
MWSTLFRQASRLAQEGYSREEVREILRRAAELQEQARKEARASGSDRVRGDALRVGAMAAGIRPEFLERALQEFHAQRRSHKGERKSHWGKWVGWAIAGLFAVPILLFVLGVVGFTFSVVLTVLLTVGLALGIAGLVLLLVSPFVGLSLLIGLAAALGGLFKGDKWRRFRHR